MQHQPDNRLTSLGRVLDERKKYYIQDTRRGYLPELYRRMGYTRGAEIGVWQGAFSEAICRDNPGVELWCVDAWMVYNEYVDFQVQLELEEAFERTKGRLRDYNTHIVRAWSLEAAKQIPDASLDFVYIDANHDKPHIGDDITAWSPKVRPGGIVSGHDYVPFHQDVMDAVDLYVCRHNCGPLLLIGDPEENGDDVDKLMSWAWVQP